MSIFLVEFTCGVPDEFITDGLKVLGCIIGEVRPEEHVCLLELLYAAGKVGSGILINEVKKLKILICTYYSCLEPVSMLR